MGGWIGIGVVLTTSTSEVKSPMCHNLSILMSRDRDIRIVTIKKTIGVKGHSYLFRMKRRT